jgi:hypothetical protein
LRFSLADVGVRNDGRAAILSEARRRSRTIAARQCPDTHIPSRTAGVNPRNTVSRPVSMRVVSGESAAAVWRSLK